MKMTGHKVNIANVAFHTVNYLMFGLFTLICIYPFYYILIYSLSDTTKASMGVYLLPEGFTLYNYYSLLTNEGIANAALITVLRTVTGTALAVFCTALFGYLLTKKELPFRRLIYRLVVMTMYINAGLIPYYMMIKAIGLRNSFFVYIIPYAVGAFNLILIKTFIEQMPPSIEESAMVDGAGYLILFVKLIFPLSLPIIATVTVFTAVFQWNSFSDNLIFVTNPKLQTLQMLLYRILQNVAEARQNVRTDEMARNIRIVQPTPTTIRMTITMIVTLPILFVYPFLQRYFVKGIMLGAVKG